MINVNVSIGLVVVDISIITTMAVTVIMLVDSPAVRRKNPRLIDHDRAKRSRPWMSSLFASAAFRERMYSSRVALIATNSLNPQLNGSRPFFAAMASARRRA